MVDTQGRRIGRSFHEIELLNEETILHVAEEAPTDNLVQLYHLFQRMVVICDQENGIGLAGTQVGVPWKVCLIKDENWRFLVNANYQPLTEEKRASIEGCLSLRNSDGSSRHFIVPRFSSVRLIGHELLTDQKLELVAVEEELEDLMSVVVQHEVDHGEGILISHIGKEISLENA